MLTAVMAQDEQDSNSISGNSTSMWLGGEITFGSMSNLDLTIGPSWGLMLGDRLGAGVTATFSIGNSVYRWDLEPYLRYYIPVADQFSFYGDAFFGIGGGDNNTNFDGGYYTTFDFGARVGLQYWLTPAWSVAASTRVLSYSYSDGNGDFGAGLRFNSVNLSLFFHF